MERGSTAAEGRSFGRTLVGIGVVGITTLVVVSSIDGSTRTDGYHQGDHWVSLLALGDRAWLGTLNLAASGVMVLLGALGFSLVLGDRRSGRWTARVLALLGASMVLAAIFPVDPVPTYPVGSGAVSPTLRGGVHAAAGAVILLGLPAVCALGAVRFRHDPRVRVVALVCTLVSAGAIAWCALLAAARGTQRWDLVHAGAFQRVLLVAGGAWVVVMGTQALRRPQPLPTRSV